MYFGHFTSTFLGVKILKKPVKKLPLVALFVGVYLPDLIDKPLMWLNLAPTRGVGHCLLLAFVLSALAAVTGWKLKRWRSTLAALCLGHFLHLAGDLVAPQVLFWPLLGELPPAKRISLWAMVMGFFSFSSWSVVKVMEFFFNSAFLCYLFTHRKQWKRSQLLAFVRSAEAERRGAESPGAECPDDATKPR